MTSPREILHSSDTNEWYTPAGYIDAARRVMGEIDLDPASCAVANETVQAARYYTRDDDGLSLSWCNPDGSPARVWLNPPYGKSGGESNQERWSRYLIRQYQAGQVGEAILLVNAVPGNAWFQDLWRALPVWTPVCFTRRISFERADGKPDRPTHGNAFFYFGPRSARFVDIFQPIGLIVARVR